MEDYLYKKNAELENTHWWFVTRRTIVKKIIDSLDLRNEAEILEFGCGTGANLKMLSEYGSVTGIEPNPIARKIASTYNIPVHDGSLPDNIPLKNKKFDLIVLMDVLEHIKEDSQSLEKISQMLTQNGKILLTVPAFQFLWSSHDRKHHHIRRYSKPELLKKIKELGLKVDCINYFFCLLFPLLFIIRSLNKLFVKKEKDDLKQTNILINYILKKISGLEAHLISKIPFPFGSSLIAVIHTETDHQ